MKKYSLILLSGASYAVWSGLVLGWLALNIHFGWEPALSWPWWRGLLLASFGSVMLGTWVNYRLGDADFIAIIWGFMLLPPLIAIIFSHVYWLGYSLIVWEWNYNFFEVISSYPLVVSGMAWGLWCFFIVPFLLLPGAFDD
ncbi:hypothetical protein EHW66_19485 [Erwinia psidii]|uniref:hypothetical protein n=1 Tax=Erwinia psidii TaxID=69224 RepID=UPI00226B20F4|nr:hypothetical protein [Erwinia psidii]MCX8967079.1 hypothetical protein [Erwinia psidii]